jgi:diguanylate cyclase (GGDEF)-like protein/PAS domain S-box-containing protein
MYRVFNCMAQEHNSGLLALAVVLCFFASFTCLIVVQRGIAAAGRLRTAWLAASGLVTGLGIWAAHFTAMIAYTPGYPISFDPATTAASFVIVVVLSMAGWLWAFDREPGRIVLGGAVVGLGLAAAHYLNMRAIRLPGFAVYEAGFVVASLVLGVSLCALSAWLLNRNRTARIPLAGAAALGMGILVLHFTGMASVALVPDPTIVVPETAFDLTRLGTLVIAAAVAMLGTAFAVAIHDQRMAERAAEDNERLQASLAALRQSEEHYRYSVDLNPQIPWIADAAGNVLEVGPRWLAVVGLSTEAALGQGWTAALHPDDLGPTLAAWDAALLSGEPLDIRYRLPSQGDGFRWFRARAQARRDANGTIVKWYGTLEDIHEQVAAEHGLREREERYRLASRATNDAIWDWHHGTDRIDWGDAVGSQLGYPEAAAGTTVSWWAERVHPDDLDRILGSLGAAVKGKSSHWTGEYRFRRADGTYADILSRGHIVRDSQGHAVRTIGAMLDISDRKGVEENLRWAANHDPLTRLPNRNLFNANLSQALEDAERDGRSVGLVVLDVDHFKMFNDTRGHSAGDALLRWIANGLAQDLPDGRTVARLGGDEFAIILPGLDDADAHADIVRAALAGLDAPFLAAGNAFTPSVSAGVAVWPRDAPDPDELLKCADLALYAGKAQGRGAFREFKPDMRAAIHQRSVMLAIASDALRDDSIIPFYQPKIDLRTGRVMGFEALLRWHDYRRGLQGPGTIAAAFEDTELSPRLTDRMIDRVLTDIRVWLDDGVPFQRIAVNGSAADFVRGDLGERLLEKLHRAALPPSCIELEVTESVFIGQIAENVERTLRTLSDAGVTIALDDFGTGYASLSHLKQFPVDVMKIDQSFIRKLSDHKRDEDNEAIVGALIGLAKMLGIRTVAEGVETVPQARHLIGKGCDLGQGFLFSRAVASSRVAALINDMPLRWHKVIEAGHRASESA